MASTHIDAPGAYPETPANEEPMQQQTQPSSRSYARETPRNMVGDAHSSGHYFNDSGISADDATLRGETTQPGASGLNYTTETSRSGATDPHSSGHHFKDSGIYADDSTLSGQSSKPGVMTGAYSRVGAKDTAPASNNNNSNNFTGLSTRGTGLQPSDALDTPTNIVPPANTPLGDINNNNNVDSGIYSNANARDSAPEDHNKVQSGLRGKSSSNHAEPYWGSIPFGAGVYNGVTGHGSDEPHPHHHHTDGTAGYGSVPATHRKSLNDSSNSNSIPSSSGVYNGVTGHGSNAAPSHDRSLDEHNAPIGTGVYNGVVGHGSNESTSPRTSRFGEDLDTNDSTRHQRAFPLGSSADSRTGAKSNDVDDAKKDSHYKEALAGAGAAWAGSHAANEYSKKDRKNEYKAAEQKPSKISQPKTYAAAEPRHHLHKETDPVVARSEKDQTFREQQPFPSENQGKKADDSKLGYYGAAAAVAGAGAYGAHEYANRDRDQKTTAAPNTNEGFGVPGTSHAARDTLSYEQPKYNKLSDGTYSGIANAGPYDDELLRQPHASAHPSSYDQSRYNNTKEDDSNLGKYGAAAAVAGAGAYGAHEYANRDREQPKYNQLSDGTDSGMPRDTQRQQNTATLPIRTQKSQAATAPQQQSKSQYNELSDGTESGIATQQPRANDTREEDSNLGKYGAAAAAAGAGAYGAHEYANRDRDQSKQNKLSDGTESGLAKQKQEPFASTIPNASSGEDKRRGVVAPISTDMPHSSAMHSKAHDTGRSSTDSSHGGQYNVLSSGTPSGINLENVEHVRFHRD